MSPDDLARRQRSSERVSRVVLHKGKLGAREVDFSPLRGPEAISMLTQLSRESWSLAAHDVAIAARDVVPVRFVRRLG